MIEHDKNRKKAYIPPKLSRVVLKTEEAILGGCKVGAGNGPGGYNTCAKDNVPCVNMAS